jgi:ATP-dependent DNA ligase
MRAERPPRLPEFVEPMLAELGSEPFDSPAHLFEIKWDGVRALAFLEGGAPRLAGRSRADYSTRFPELAELAQFPPGTLLDGELVAWKNGKPDFHQTMQRIHTQAGPRVRALARTNPVAYVVFDMLYRNGSPLLARPLSERRAALEELFAGRATTHVFLSEGLIGAGVEFYARARARALEGIVAKRLASPYRPGTRSDDWIKLKPRTTLVCVVLGYLAEGNDLRSLLIAAEDQGRLAYLGRVGAGMSEAVRVRLLEQCRSLEAPAPFLACEEDACWIRPGLYCTVSYLERSETGLRSPIFVDSFLRP